MGAVATKAGADVRRRRLQTAVLAIVLFLASGAATLALNILVASHAPFEQAFGRANGAHLVVDYQAAIGENDVRATAANSQVTASAGPWVVATAAIGGAGGGQMGGQTVSGRSDPNGPVDEVTISGGRWWRTDGEAVISWETSQIFGMRVGDLLTVYHSPGPAVGMDKLPGLGPLGGKQQPNREPVATLTIVGIAQSVSTPDTVAWLSPTVIASLADGTPNWQMLYRVDPSTTTSDLGTAVAAITSGLPATAVTGTYSYLETRADVDGTATLYVPVLLAFSAFALAAAAFTIANVVGGVVLTSYRDIGVMKAVGFTPTQVVAILVAQVLLPAIVGSLTGTLAGTLASVSTVERMTQSFGLPGTFTLSVPVLVAVIGTCVLVSLVAAVIPAMQAGRLSAVGAITRGSAPSIRANGGRLRRLGLRLPVGLPLRLGIAAGLSHPARATMTLGALLVGVAAVTFALGLNLSLVRVMEQLDRTEASPVRVMVADPTTDGAAVTATIAADPDTGHFVAIGQASVTVRAVGEVPFVGYDGDTSWLGYAVIRGRWFAAPTEIVASSNLIRRAGLSVGDTVEIGSGGRTITFRLVGEVFDSSDESRDNLTVRGLLADVSAIDPTVRSSRWEVQPAAGVEPSGYAGALVAATNGAVLAYTTKDSADDEEFLLFLSVVALMGIVLVAISLGGVFNTVLLETRQRTREMAVLKAIGLAPKQVVAMVVSSVVPAGLVAGLVGVPLGLVLVRVVINYLGDTAANTAVPDSAFDVLAPLAVAGLALTGLAIASVGAYLPGQRAARARIAPVLQAE